MFEKKNEKFLDYFFSFMLGKDEIQEFCDHLGIKYKKSETISETARKVRRSGKLVTLEKAREWARKTYFSKARDIEPQIELLRSRKLENHSWHGARPGSLHQTIQRWIRKELLDDPANFFPVLEKRMEELGRHEVFIVLASNILEHTIIEAEGVTPNLRYHGLSDFAIGDLPYDEKDTKLPRGFAKDHGTRQAAVDKLKSDPGALLEWLYDNQGRRRIRKDAKEAPPEYAYNRFCIIIDPPSLWESHLARIRRELENFIEDIYKGKKPPYHFKRHGAKISSQLFFLGEINDHLKIIKR